MQIAINGYIVPVMDTTPILDYVLARLDAREIPQKVVAHRSGVPFSTVAKIAQRATEDPSVRNVQKLYDFFRSIDAEDCSDGVGSGNG